MNINRYPGQAAKEAAKRQMERKRIYYAFDSHRDSCIECVDLSLDLVARGKCEKGRELAQAVYECL